MTYAVEFPNSVGGRCFLMRGTSGDPPRTYSEAHAARYKTEPAAKAAITRALKTCPIRPRAMIVVPHPIQ